MAFYGLVCFFGGKEWSMHIFLSQKDSEQRDPATKGLGWPDICVEFQGLVPNDMALPFTFQEQGNLWFLFQQAVPKR